jgi:hypothetical protein
VKRSLLIIASLCLLCFGLIAVQAKEPVNLFESPTLISAETCALDLFASPEVLTVISGDAAGQPLNLFAMNEAGPPRVETVTPPSPSAEAALPDTRPVVVIWSPSWCFVCRWMQGLIGTGDERVRVRWIKTDDDATFPKEVRDYAASRNAQGGSQGYPVVQFQPVDGKGQWLFTGSRPRTLNELAALSKLRVAESK